MAVTHENVNGVDVFRIKGNLVLAVATEVKSTIKPVASDTTVSKILIDMSDVAVIDSTGIVFLVTVLKATKKRSASFGLCNVNEVIVNIFKSTHLDDMFSIYPTEEEALANL